MKITIVELQGTGDGVDFWEHAFFKVKIDGEIKAHTTNIYNVLELIETALKEKSYSNRPEVASASS